MVHRDVLPIDATDSGDRRGQRQGEARECADWRHGYSGARYSPMGRGGVVMKMIEYIDPVNPPNTSKTRVTDYTYDASGLNVTKVEVTGSRQTIETTYTYDSLGRTLTETIKRQTSPLDATQVSLTTSYLYDDLDRVTKVTDPLGNETVTTYDKNGNVTQVTCSGLKRSDSSYDERVVSTQGRMTPPTGLITDTDVNGAVTPLCVTTKRAIAFR